MTSQLVNQIEKSALPILEASGLELVEVQFRREPQGWVLRLFVDRQAGVNLDDCKRVSQQLSLALDVEGIMDKPYHLEVSSPGLNRPLRKERDFLRFRGKKVKIKTSVPYQGQRNFNGYLLDLKEGEVQIDCGDRQVSLPLSLLVKANLEYEFKDGRR
jgi:ribosome maturation factor RimP